MNLKEWNAMQIVEALGDVNRYFFWMYHNREPFNDDELLLYYIEHNGAKQYDINHYHEREVKNEQEKSKEN